VSESYTVVIKYKPAYRFKWHWYVYAPGAIVNPGTYTEFGVESSEKKARKKADRFINEHRRGLKEVTYKVRICD